jgi:hypothetical protein
MATPPSTPVSLTPPMSRLWRCRERANGGEYAQIEFAQYTGASKPRILSPKHKLIGSEVSPVICTCCGYVMDFVNPADFRQSQLEALQRKAPKLQRLLGGTNSWAS